jgi:hypothetical protein
MNAELFKTVVLSHARLDSLTDLTFDTNVELQNRIPSSGIEPNARSYVREDSRLDAMRLVITRAGGSVIPAAQIVKIVIKPGSVQVTLAKDTFRQAGEARGATVATRPYYHFGPGAPVPIETR